MWLPEEEALGTVVFMHSRRDTTPDFIIDYGLRNHLAIIYLSTHNPFEFLFTTQAHLQLESHLNMAMTAYNLDRTRVLFCGMSLAGTRAIKMALFASSEASRYAIRPIALAICDAPLDMRRFYYATRRAYHLNVHPAASNEGKWVSEYLSTQLEGTPDTNEKAFLEYSPYSYVDRESRVYPGLEHIHMRTYAEPDVNWWMDTRKKDYYDMNAIDMAGIINELQIRGHSNVSFIPTVGRGFRSDGSRHPHSWTIVDEEELINWFLKVIHAR